MSRARWVRLGGRGQVILFTFKRVKVEGYTTGSSISDLKTVSRTNNEREGGR